MIAQTELSGDAMKTVQEIADYVDGQIHGEGHVELNSVGSLDKATAGDLAYAETAHLEQVSTTGASCVLVPTDKVIAATFIVVKNPRVAFARAAQWLLDVPRTCLGIHETASIATDATISPDASVGAWTVVESGAVVESGTRIFPGSYIGPGCHIGRDCTLYPRVVLYPGVQLGDRVVLHSGVVVGADGFGFVFDGKCHIKIPQIGHVQINSDVEIGANSCIDRGTFDKTEVETGVKIDNLCQIAHNVRIGPHATISSQTGIAGSSTIGQKATIGGQVGIADYCRIDDHGVVGAQCGVPSKKRIPAGQVFWGTPARPLKDIKLQQAHLGQLPKMRAAIQQLQAEIHELKARLS